MIKIVKYLASVSVMFNLARHEADHIIECAEKHYDDKVKSMVVEKGLVQPVFYNWKSRAYDKSPICAETLHIDLAVKALEADDSYASFLLREDLKQIMRSCSGVYCAMKDLLTALEK